MVQLILDQLKPKWDIRTRPPNDDLNLTPKRKSKNKQAEKTGDAILFDPNITTNNIRDSFRVFTTDKENDHLPSHREAQQAQLKEIVVYTDGSCTNNGQEDAQAGSGIWYGENDPRNTAIRVPGKVQSNQTGELYAILHVAKMTPKEAPIMIKSDSQYVIKGLTKNLTPWEDKGWIGTSNSELFKVTAAWLRSRNSTTSFKWVKGHDGEIGNEEADKLAAEGALLPPVENPDLNAPVNYVHTGAN